MSAIFPPFVRVGLVPDTISYIGIALLAGVILYFLRKPSLAVVFLAFHVVCDGMDGAYARYTGKASQSGAFTDLVCDQLGMVVVAMMAIFHHMVSPVLGAAYIALYLIVVVFGVIINVMEIGTRITITSKYFMYLVYAIWAVWDLNLFPVLMSFFSGIMAVEVTIGYLRLKRGIRKKFDTQVRFTQGDPYSGRLNYALNVAVPVTVLLIILLGANWVPINAMLDSPKQQVVWREGPRLISEDEAAVVLGVGIYEKGLLVMMRDSEGTVEMARFPMNSAESDESFILPGYICPAITRFPVDGELLLIADSSTRLLMGIDLEASFTAKRAVMALTLPLEYLRVTAMAVGRWNDKRAWLASNYLYTRKTYVVDPELALKKGYLLGGEIASYTNGGFPSGLTLKDDVVVEFNKSPFQQLLYIASLKRMVRGVDLLKVARTSFAPPPVDAFGPLVFGEDLLMVSQHGQVYRLPSIMGQFTHDRK
ncbi:MAG TPA: CDP-alcohol phosphatidyltransferase family protein [Desulfomonilaceae bacterium]|nr:CDP-alcohol phosphatidyltransferase family protein [Desulfomonilaceae bacterium]